MVVVCLHFSADIAVWWQQGKAVTCERTGEAGRWGVLKWLPVPCNEFLLESLAKLSVGLPLCNCTSTILMIDPAMNERKVQRYSRRGLHAHYELSLLLWLLL